MSAQVAADLRAAAEVLRRDGWTQGTLVAANGCRCVMGGISAAIDPTNHQKVLRTDALWFRMLAAERALADVVDAMPVAWNDAPGRTADEVIAALEAAADAAEADQ